MKLLLVFFSALLVTSAGAARADVPPLNSSQCGALQAGAACTLEQGGAGVCEDQTCARARPGGNSEYPCRICVPAPAEPVKAATEAPVAPKKSSSCAAGGLDVLVALGAAAVIIGARRRRHAL